jgi:hypothetical protein
MDRGRQGMKEGGGQIHPPGGNSGRASSLANRPAGGGGRRRTGADVCRVNRKLRARNCFAGVGPEREEQPEAAGRRRETGE